MAERKPGNFTKKVIRGIGVLTVAVATGSVATYVLEQANPNQVPNQVLPGTQIPVQPSTFIPEITPQQVEPSQASPVPVSEPTPSATEIPQETIIPEPISEIYTEDPNSDALKSPQQRALEQNPGVSIEGAADTIHHPSDTAVGSLNADIILVDGENGTEQPWTDAEKQDIQNGFNQAANFWGFISGGFTRIRLNSMVETHLPSSDPIQMKASQEGEWMSKILTGFGYPGDYFEAGYQYDQQVRNTPGKESDHATTIFVVKALNDSDGTFADGRRSHTFLKGPFMVLVYNPHLDGSVADILAHEFGHIFGALDQYAQALQDCNSTAGFFLVRNYNSRTGQCADQTHNDGFMLRLGGPSEKSALEQVGLGAGTQFSLRIAGSIDPSTVGITIEGDSAHVQGTLKLVDAQPLDGSLPIGNTIVGLTVIDSLGNRIPLTPEDGKFDSAIEKINRLIPRALGITWLSLEAEVEFGGKTVIITKDLGTGPTQPNGQGRPRLYLPMVQRA